MTKQQRMDEYLRRNNVHCKAVGAGAALDKAYAILIGWKRPPVRLTRLILDAIDRQHDVIEEVASHRDEIKVR